MFVSFETSRDQLIDALIESGRLQEWDSEDNEKLLAALRASNIEVS